MSGRILIVDDDSSMCQMLAEDLRRRRYEVVAQTSAEAALHVVENETVDVVLTDLRMQGMDGLALCEKLATLRPGVPVLVMTAFGSLDTAIAAIRAGAYDFVTKPVELDILHIALERALEHRRLQDRVKVLGAKVRQTERYHELVGDSPPMRDLFDQIDRIADSEATVLVTGETGTGKELVARALHHHSRRRDGPFCAINCSAMPETLLESELFGHAQGAFTDARTARKGLLLEADRGTLFLDEIGDCPLTLQPKLLRALEERTVRPVGSETEIDFDVRIVAATNRDLEEAVDEKRFREDLYFRLNVIQLALPPLRSRGADILLLAQRFLGHFAERAGKDVHGITRAAAERLLAYAWPGNVRELRNAVERAVALTRTDHLMLDDMPKRIRTYHGSQVVLGGHDPRELVSLEEVERRYILHVLKAVAGNKAAAARLLGIDRRTLYRKLTAFGLEHG